MKCDICGFEEDFVTTSKEVYDPQCCPECGHPLNINGCPVIYCNNHICHKEENQNGKSEYYKNCYEHGYDEDILNCPAYLKFKKDKPESMIKFYGCSGCKAPKEDCRPCFLSNVGYLRGSNYTI